VKTRVDTVHYEEGGSSKSLIRRRFPAPTRLRRARWSDWSAGNPRRARGANLPGRTGRTSRCASSPTRIWPPTRASNRAEPARSRFGSVTCAFVLHLELYHAKVGAGARVYDSAQANQNLPPTANCRVPRSWYGGRSESNMHPLAVGTHSEAGYINAERRNVCTLSGAQLMLNRCCAVIPCT